VIRDMEYLMSGFVERGITTEILPLTNPSARSEMIAQVLE